MALSASKVSSCPRDCFGISNSYAKSLQRSSFHCSNQGVELRQLNYGCLLTEKKSVYNDGSWHVFVKPVSFSVSQRSSDIHLSRGTHNTTEKESFTTYNDCAEKTGSQIGGEDEHPVFPERTIHSSQGLTEACKFVFNDAKFVNERARNDIILLSRGILSLDARARQDVAILGSEFLKLDARAKEDSEIIDRKVKKKAERLHHIARILKDKAESRLKSVADKHWSDGALEADLRRADIHAKQRALQDALMALEIVKDIHDMMVNKMYNFPRQRTIGMQADNEMLGHIMLEKNSKTLNFPPGQVSPDQITAIQEVYWSVASALSEADGFDYTNPEELELIIATLIDLDAMDGKSSVSLLAECSSSPDVNTRQALANALAAAPSMWTLGNAGMGALQRLAEDSNLAIASAATRAIYELKKQWEIEEGDNWRFTMNQYTMEEKGEDQEADDDLNSD